MKNGENGGSTIVCMYILTYLKGVFDTLLVYNLLISNVKEVERCVRGVGLGAYGVRG